jgi:hypothetical protein
MTSKVEICNLALSNIRSSSINSIDESSIGAQQCKLKYDILRKMLLKTTPWGFCHKIIALAVLDTEVFNWSRAYQYPVDCLLINRLVGEQEKLENSTADVVSRFSDSQLFAMRNSRTKVQYEIYNFSNNKIIASNSPNLRIDYIADVVDTNLFPDTLVLAFSHLLASEIAIPIVGAETGRQLRSDSLAMYNQYLDSALVDNLNEQHSDVAESEFITVRR